MKAFLVTTRHFPGVKAWYCGETSSRARYPAFLDVSDLQPTAKIMDIIVRRAPEFDHLAAKHRHPGSISELVAAERLQNYSVGAAA